MKCELYEYQERLRCNKPPTAYDCLEISLPSSFYTIVDRYDRQQLCNRYEKLIQKAKIDFIAVHIAGLHARIYQDESMLKKEIDTMWKNYHDKNRPNEQKMTKLFIQLMTKRSSNMKAKFKVTHDFTINYHIRYAYEHPFEKNSNTDEEQCLKHIGFLPTLIIDPSIATITRQQLTKSHIQLLNRGPTYIPPGQLHIRLDRIIKKQYAPLKHQLARFFDKYNINISRRLNFESKLFEDFQHLYSLPLPNDIYQRALYEKQLIQSIEDFLKKNNLILRRSADQTNLFYLGPKKQFIDMCHQYMQSKTDTYTILLNSNKQDQLQKRCQSINEHLQTLYTTKRLTEEMFNIFRIKIDRIEIPYLSFLPDYSMVSQSLL